MTIFSLKKNVKPLSEAVLQSSQRASHVPPSLTTAAISSALDRTDPVAIETRPGIENDGIDRLQLVKDPEASSLASIFGRMQKDAETEPDIAAMFKNFNLWKPETERVEAFRALGIGEALADLMGRFGIEQSSTIADVGCGSGWLSYSLNKAGFQNLVAMEPSAGSTKTLQSMAPEISVVEDLDEWRAIRHRFDALVSVATVHHWDHIPWIALEARRTMKPGAYWFAIMEWFADTPAEFLQAMSTHPTRERYGLYEWAYPASAYVDLIQSVGFSLSGVVPMYYRDSCYLSVRNLLKTPEGLDLEALNTLVDDRLTGPNGTVELFWAEVDARRRTPGMKLFSRPQVLIFRRTADD